MLLRFLICSFSLSPHFLTPLSGLTACRALGIHETTDAEKISHARYIEGLHARITEREARARLHEATDGSREGAKTPVQDTASAEKVDELPLIPHPHRTPPPPPLLRLTLLSAIGEGGDREAHGEHHAKQHERGDVPGCGMPAARTDRWIPSSHFVCLLILFQERRQRENERQEDEHAYSLEGAVDINSIVKETVGQGERGVCIAWGLFDVCTKN